MARAKKQKVSKNWDSRIAELDHQRYTDPEAALRRVREALEDCPELAGARLLGVAGSCQRLLLRLDEAKGDLYAGLETAEKLGAVTVQAELYQRSSYVASDLKRPELALQIISEAHFLYETAGDRAGVGRTLVDRGRVLFYLERDEAAVAAQERALELLPESDTRNRFAALNGLGIYSLNLGDLPRSKGFSRRSQALQPALPLYFSAPGFWLDGRQLMAAGRPGAAAASYSKALDYYLPSYPGQAAIVGVELVTAQFYAGQVGEAVATAHRLLYVAAELHRNPIVCRALQNLFGCRQLSRAVVEASLEKVLRELDPSSRRWRRISRAVRQSRHWAQHAGQGGRH
jgi:tetratricopeptide (TPR) repeat protein